ncbi:DUF2127 domain-containing protein [Aliinostoc sp. HNIBRCY26]|uniref:DUF2127 domain-containing protein n=1 Tax=Aliinostoc sp. HNIBRCY26 TaxID=3418997 RepID=UPI003D03A129
MLKKRPSVLIAIVIYKGFVTLLLTATSLVLLLAFKKHDALVTFAESYMLEGKRQAIELFLERIINIQPQTIKFSGIVTGIYAAVTAIEAMGLWYKKTWATILVIVLVAISIPPEIYELIKGITILKIVIFTINIAVLWYLIKHYYQH